MTEKHGHNGILNTSDGKEWVLRGRSRAERGFVVPRVAAESSRQCIEYWWTVCSQRQIKTIALAIEHFDPLKGGAESYVVALARALIERGWEVHLFGRSWKGEPAGAVFHEIRDYPFLPKWARLLQFAMAHRKLAKKRDFSVVVGFGQTLAMDVYQSHGGVHRYATRRKMMSAETAGERLRREIATFLSMKDKVRNFIEAAPFRMTPRPKIIAISDMVKNDFSRFYGVAPDSFKVIYNGVDLSRFNPSLRMQARDEYRRQDRIDASDVVFLFLSYTLKRKGLLPLIRAAALLRKKGLRSFRVIVAGKIPAENIRRMTVRQNVEDIIVFKGPTADPERLYAQADVFVLPTYYDACALVVIEAMACGLPVITTEYCGAAGLISQGKNGLVINRAPDPKELSEAMEVFFCRETLARFSAQAARAGAQCSVTKNHDAVIGVFEESAAEHIRSPR